jgi:hypothetical protein
MAQIGLSLGNTKVEVVPVFERKFPFLRSHEG